MFVCSNIIAEVWNLMGFFFEPTEEKHTNLTQTVHWMKKKKVKAEFESDQLDLQEISCFGVWLERLIF